jgi:hypothetical protein
VGRATAGGVAAKGLGIAAVAGPARVEGLARKVAKAEELTGGSAEGGATAGPLRNLYSIRSYTKTSR